jgi:hypothetical protein
MRPMNLRVLILRAFAKRGLLRSNVTHRLFLAVVFSSAFIPIEALASLGQRAVEGSRQGLYSAPTHRFLATDY